MIVIVTVYTLVTEYRALMKTNAPSKQTIAKSTLLVLIRMVPLLVHATLDTAEIV